MDVPLSLTRRAPSPQPPDEGVRFVPAGWVTAALTVSRVVLRGGRLGKLGIAGLAWTFLPRKVKLVAIGLALAAVIVVIGSLSAFALLLLQLS
jgi:hypothetical protein